MAFAGVAAHGLCHLNAGDHAERSWPNYCLPSVRLYFATALKLGLGEFGYQHATFRVQKFMSTL